MCIRDRFDLLWEIRNIKHFFGGSSKIFKSALDPCLFKLSRLSIIAILHPPSPEVFEKKLSISLTLSTGITSFNWVDFSSCICSIIFKSVCVFSDILLWIKLLSL